MQTKPDSSQQALQAQIHTLEQKVQTLTSENRSLRDQNTKLASDLEVH